MRSQPENGVSYRRTIYAALRGISLVGGGGGFEGDMAETIRLRVEVEGDGIVITLPGDNRPYDFTRSQVMLLAWSYLRFKPPTKLEPAQRRKKERPSPGKCELATDIGRTKRALTSLQPQRSATCAPQPESTNKVP